MAGRAACLNYGAPLRPCATASVLGALYRNFGSLGESRKGGAAGLPLFPRGKTNLFAALHYLTISSVGVRSKCILSWSSVYFTLRSPRLGYENIIDDKRVSGPSKRIKKRLLAAFK